MAVASKKIYNTLDALQADVDVWLDFYNKEHPHSGKFCYGKIPWQNLVRFKTYCSGEIL
ncbi:MAG: hypothetical protein HY819_11585 [Acidobacteria bacterium]|nr:hypothetical protein [Acidobacteriota bacterium]